MTHYQICTRRLKPRQYLRGGYTGMVNKRIILAPHVSGKDLDNVIEWIQGYGANAGHAAVTQSRNKREGFYWGKKLNPSKFVYERLDMLKKGTYRQWHRRSDFHMSLRSRKKFAKWLGI